MKTTIRNLACRTGLLTVCALAANAVATGQTPATKPQPSNQTDSGMVLLSPFEVKTEADDSYSTSTSVSGARITTGIADLSMTVNIITKDFLDDVGIR